jgi:orotate phosphoribosyltransferase
VDFGVPFVSLLQLDIPTFDPEDCPLCKSGIPITKPGSSDK